MSLELCNVDPTLLLKILTLQDLCDLGLAQRP